jgi:hypothetical protein
VVTEPARLGSGFHENSFSPNGDVESKTCFRSTRTRIPDCDRYFDRSRISRLIGYLLGFRKAPKSAGNSPTAGVNPAKAADFIGKSLIFPRGIQEGKRRF